jgi:phytoene dehydrogenase-like protein
VPLGRLRRQGPFHDTATYFPSPGWECFQRSLAEGLNFSYPEELRPLDTIIIGAGIGGLAAAARLAAAGQKVLVLEKNPHIGGTAYIFRRGPYYFPMGPLSLSHPGRISSFLARLGIEDEIEFRRNHFQLIAPDLDIVYSRPLDIFQEELAEAFPSEMKGIDRFFSELHGLLDLIRDIDEWHPGFSAGPRKKAAERQISKTASNIQSVDKWSRISSSLFLNKLGVSPRLKNLLGSQGTGPPEMSMLQLAFMWAAMSEAGIWAPSCGIHGLCRRLSSALSSAGGDVQIGYPVKEILIDGGRASAVRTIHGEVIPARWVVSNADYKKTFFELISPGFVPLDDLAFARRVPYTDSELCVYLGIKPDRVDFGRMRTEHLFFRKEIRNDGEGEEEDFAGHEIEICRWSDNAPDSAPEGRMALILRVGFPYDFVSAWRTGEKKRKAGYREYKNRLAWRLIGEVESILPGLSNAVEILEVATPLTYRDWGQRTLGSIAGWTREAAAASLLPAKILVETPFENLYTTGIYAASDLFLGGVPTAIYTAELAADIILSS